MVLLDSTYKVKDIISSYEFHDSSHRALNPKHRAFPGGVGGLHLQLLSMSRPWVVGKAGRGLPPMWGNSPTMFQEQ